jgi:hypothetical protein
MEQTLVNKTIVLELISNGKTEDALMLLQQSGYPEATPLYDTFKAHKRSLHLGMLQYAEWTALEKEWHKEILTWQYAEDTTPQKILSPTDKWHIEQLLQLNKTKEAVHFGKDFGNAFFLLLGSYNQIINNSKMGLITEADKKQQLEAINAAIRHLIA